VVLLLDNGKDLQSRGFDIPDFPVAKLAVSPTSICLLSDHAIKLLPYDGRTVPPLAVSGRPSRCVFSSEFGGFVVTFEGNDRARLVKQDGRSLMDLSAAGDLGAIWSSQLDARSPDYLISVLTDQVLLRSRHGVYGKAFCKGVCEVYSIGPSCFVRAENALYRLWDTTRVVQFLSSGKLQLARCDPHIDPFAVFDQLWFYGRQRLALSMLDLPDFADAVDDVLMLFPLRLGDPGAPCRFRSGGAKLQPKIEDSLLRVLRRLGSSPRRTAAIFQLRVSLERFDEIRPEPLDDGSKQFLDDKIREQERLENALRVHDVLRLADRELLETHLGWLFEHSPGLAIRLFGETDVLSELVNFVERHFPAFLLAVQCEVCLRTSRPVGEKPLRAMFSNVDDPTAEAFSRVLRHSLEKKVALRPTILEMIAKLESKVCQAVLYAACREGRKALACFADTGDLPVYGRVCEEDPQLLPVYLGLVQGQSLGQVFDGMRGMDAATFLRSLGDNVPLGDIVEIVEKAFLDLMASRMQAQMQVSALEAEELETGLRRMQLEGERVVVADSPCDRDGCMQGDKPVRVRTPGGKLYHLGCQPKPA
jgi:hypothetical protein